MRSDIAMFLVNVYYICLVAFAPYLVPKSVKPASSCAHPWGDTSGGLASRHSPQCRYVLILSELGMSRFPNRDERIRESPTGAVAVVFSICSSTYYFLDERSLL